MAQDPYRTFKAQAAQALSKALAELGVATEPALDRPPEGMGDLAFPCFPLAKTMRKAPNVIAQELAARIVPGGMVERVAAKGGYVNFHVRFEDLAQAALEDAVARKERFGAGDPKGVRTLLEHTSANPTGPLHVGRARNPIIGDTIARILRMAGHDLTTEFYVNDVGRQVAVMTWGVKHLELEREPERDADHFRHVLYYQQANRLAEEDPEVLRQIDEMLVKLEHGDAETVRLAREACEKVLRAVTESMARINISYDGFTWESKFVLDGTVDRVIEKLKASEHCREEEGAFHLELESFGISGRARLHSYDAHEPPLPVLEELRVPRGERYVEGPCGCNQKSVRGIATEALSLLMAHDWPGNVRELQNAIQRYVAVGRFDIPMLSKKKPHSPGAGIDAGQGMIGQTSSLKGEIERLEKASLKEALKRHGGNKSKTAQALGISRKTLFRKLKRYGDL